MQEAKVRVSSMCATLGPVYVLEDMVCSLLSGVKRWWLICCVVDLS